MANLQVAEAISHCLQSMQLAVTTVLMNEKIFDSLPKSDEKHLSASAIVSRSSSKLNVSMLSRLLDFLVTRSLVSYHYGLYKHTQRSEIYVSGTLSADIIRMWDVHGLPNVMQLSSWIDKHVDRIPDTTCNPMTLRAEAEGTSIWEIFDQSQDGKKILHRGLAALGWATRPFVGLFNFERAYSERYAAHDSPFLVDIGGADGAFVSAVLRTSQALAETAGIPRSSIAPASIVIQDSGSSLSAARSNKSIPSGVVLQEHDFFRPQSIREATLYHLRACLHDYDDEQCIRILTNIASAMGPRSKLLIADEVLSDVPTPGEEFGHFMDVWMASFGGRERSKDDFLRIIKNSQLQIEFIHMRKDTGTWAVIEAVRSAPEELITTS